MYDLINKCRRWILVNIYSFISPPAAALARSGSIQSCPFVRLAVRPCVDTFEHKFERPASL